MTSTRSFSVAPVVAVARRGVPVVQTLHNYELISASPTDHRGGRLDRGQDAASVRWLRAALNVTRRTLHVPRVNRWIAVSSYVAETYARHGIGADVLPNFIAAEPPGTSRSFEERRGIVFAGRLTAEKGVNDVIALAEHLRGDAGHGRGARAARTAGPGGGGGPLRGAGGEDIRVRTAGLRGGTRPTRFGQPPR